MNSASGSCCPVIDVSNQSVKVTWPANPGLTGGRTGCGGHPSDEGAAKIIKFLSAYTVIFPGEEWVIPFGLTASSRAEQWA